MKKGQFTFLLHFNGFLWFLEMLKTNLHILQYGYRWLVKIKQNKKKNVKDLIK